MSEMCELKSCIHTVFWRQFLYKNKIAYFLQATLLGFLVNKTKVKIHRSTPNYLYFNHEKSFSLKTIESSVILITKIMTFFMAHPVYSLKSQFIFYFLWSILVKKLVKMGKNWLHKIGDGLAYKSLRKSNFHFSSIFHPGQLSGTTQCRELI